MTDKQSFAIELDSGKIKGKGADGYHYYLGIPFAAPPVGDLRWKPPQPVERWSGVKECTEFGPSCPQSPFPGFDVGRMNEDCLYLNVWTSAGSPGDRLPVMVWIYGGGYQWGSASQVLYDGASLAKKGAVVVTINYRVGALGFLTHPQLVEDSREGLVGNYGILDNIAALEWVQRNISAFGGDPSRVTIFGESAGASSVLALMQSPLTEGLFHRAIAQSLGHISSVNLFPVQIPDYDVTTAQSLASNLGCGQATDVLAAMRAKTAEEIVAATAGPPQMMFIPKPDDKVVSRAWLSPRDEKPRRDVPLIIGTMASELGTMAPMTPYSPPQVIAGLLQMFQPWETYIQRMFGERAEKILALFPADTPEDIQSALDKLATATTFCNSKFFAEQLSSPRYVYQFARVPNWEHSKSMGAYHGLDVGYVFGGPRMFMEQIEYQTEDRALSKVMMDYWTAFAAAGDPNGSGRPHWPAYDPASDKHLEFDAESTVKSGLFNELCDLLR